MKLLALTLLLPTLVFSREHDKDALLRGIHIGQTEAQVKRTLPKSADFQREEEGQQVWKLKSDPVADFLLVGYDTDHRVRYITVVAKKDQPLRCEVLGDISKAKSEGKPGNMHFTQPVGDPDEKIIAIARGDSPDHISLCSLKRVGAKTEEDEDEARERAERRKH